MKLYIWNSIWKGKKIIMFILFQFMFILIQVMEKYFYGFILVMDKFSLYNHALSIFIK